jgi:hypothetical protein
MRFLLVAVAVLVAGCSSIPKAALPPSVYDVHVHPVLIGPMIGNVTDHNIRLWGKGDRQAIGVARFREAGTEKWGEPVKFHLNPDADYTGIVENDASYPLKPDTTYQYQMGYVHETLENRLGELVWDSKTWQAHTFPANDSNVGTRFIFGSCRDQFIFSHYGENTFENINSLLNQESEMPTEAQSQFIIQAGDQVNRPRFTRHVPAS